MDMNDLILVSVDDHVVEPPDLFERHVSKADLERAPQVIHKDEMDADVWTFEGTEIPNVGLNAVAAARRRSTASSRPRSTRCRHGCYDIHERVRDMNVNGVLGSLCFPSMPGFCGQLFSRTRPTRTRRCGCSRPTTTGTSTSGAARYPGRFIPLALAPIWDPELMAAEVRRVAEKGCHAVTFSENPDEARATRASTPTTGTRSGRRARTTGTVVCLHIGSSSTISSRPTTRRSTS